MFQSLHFDLNCRGKRTETRKMRNPKLKTHCVLWRNVQNVLKNAKLPAWFFQGIMENLVQVQRCTAAGCHWPPWRRGWRRRWGDCTCRQTSGRQLPWWPSPWRCRPVDQSAAARHSLLWTPCLLLYRGNDDTLSDAARSYKATVCRILNVWQRDKLHGSNWEKLPEMNGLKTAHTCRKFHRDLGAIRII